MYGKYLIEKIESMKEVFVDNVYKANENPFGLNSDQYLLKIGKLSFTKSVNSGVVSVSSCGGSLLIKIELGYQEEIVDKKPVLVSKFTIEVGDTNLFNKNGVKKQVVTELLLNSFDDENFLAKIIQRMAVEFISEEII